MFANVANMKNLFFENPNDADIKEIGEIFYLRDAIIPIDTSDIKDVLEGADILMVKPALSYLDVIRRVKDNYNLPLAAYNVSGEYAMLKSAVKNGILSEGAIYESILSIKRAGADIIITYFAKDLAKMIRDNK